jgi:branched-chain amino acid transport system substrate-binding protein
MAPLAYSQMQVVGLAIEGTGSLDDAALSEFTRRAVFSTVMGNITFGARGEWTHPRVLQVQFQGVVGNVSTSSETAHGKSSWLRGRWRREC